MDNITHTLVGLVAAKAGLERVSPYATTLCIVAANAPDADIITVLGGRWSYLQQHRGISHSIVGVLAFALLLPLIFYAGDWLAARVRKRPVRVRLRGLFIASLLLCASHPLMDWTNSYGVRPLLPWSGQWYYGDLVFILDPFIWLTLGGAAFLLTAQARWRVGAWMMITLVFTAAILLLPQRAGMPFPFPARVLWVIGIVGLLVAHHKRVAMRWGRALASAALILIVAYWGVLALAHQSALSNARLTAETVAKQHDEKLIRVATMPLLADPTHWLSIAETDRATYRFNSALSRPVEDDLDAAHFARYEKPQGTGAAQVALAVQDERAAIFLNFARFPVEHLQTDCLGQTLVQFADLRFSEPGRGGRNTGFSVEINVPPQP